MTPADFMAEAVRLARDGMRRGDGGPFGAVIVRQGEIIARGWNCVLRDQDPTAHAEINAIRAACRALGQFHLEECELHSSCEPCPMCLAACQWARLRAVHYAATRHDAEAAGFADAALYAEASRAPSQRRCPCHHRPFPAAAALLRAWRDKPDKTPY